MCKKLSIVVPHRNSVKKLQELLATIPQTSMIQVIVVDDDSEDAQRASQLTETYPLVEFICNTEEEKNAGSARNCGLRIATAPWLMFADADDRFMAGAFDVVFAVLDSVAADVDLVYFRTTSWDEENNNVGFRHQATDELLERVIASGNTAMLRYEWPSPCAKAIRAALVRRHDIEFESVVAGNDVVFSQLCGHYARQVSWSNNVVYCIRESRGSLTAVLTSERALARLDVLVRSNANILKWGAEKRLDWGFTWFLASKPWAVSAKKTRVYAAYLCSLATRARRRLRMRAVL